MNLFRKKITLPEGPARMSVSPSLPPRRSEITTRPRASASSFPKRLNYNEERGRQLARSDSYATFFKTGVGCSTTETACTAEKHLAESREALTRYTRNDGIHLSRSRSQPDHPGRTASGVITPKRAAPSSPPRPVRHARPRNPRTKERP